jgi:hypothetical protein
LAINLDIWKGFESEEAMVAEGMFMSISDLLGAVAFHNVSENGTGSLPSKGLQYSIRMNEIKT